MTDSELNLIAAKLREQLIGNLEPPEDSQIRSWAGLVEPEAIDALGIADAAARDLEGAPELLETEFGQDVLGSLASKRANSALERGNGPILSYLTGITEQDLEADQIKLVGWLVDELESDELTTALVAGRPNTGKTNLVWLLEEIASRRIDDLVTISNARAGVVDHRATSAHELTVLLLRHRMKPKFVVVDEGSTHFDARTQQYNVADQWSPLLKRMAKLNVCAVVVVGHTGKDVDPEVKRLTTLGIYKTAVDEAGFYESWPHESDRPADQLFGGDVSSLEPTAVDYDPDEPAPWSWNLRSGLFAHDLDWSELLDRLEQEGPADG